MNKLPVTENDVKAVCIDYLRKRGYYVQRLNSGKTRIPYTKKVKYGKQVFDVPTERYINMSEAGTPDLMAFKKSKCDPAEIAANYQYAVELIFIECKRPGNKPTELQLNKMQELELYGAKCITAWDVNDLIKAGI